MYIQWNITHPQKRTRKCHLQGHRWTQRLSYCVIKSDRKDKYHMLPLICGILKKTVLLGWPKSLLRFFPSDVTVRSSNTMEEWLWRTTHGLCNILLYPFQQQCFAWPYALLNMKRQGNVPGGPVVESLPSNAGSITGRDPTCLMAKKQNIKQQKQYCNKFSKDFKKLHIKKKKI